MLEQIKSATRALAWTALTVALVAFIVGAGALVGYGSAALSNSMVVPLLPTSSQLAFGYLINSVSLSVAAISSLALGLGLAIAPNQTKHILSNLGKALAALPRAIFASLSGHRVEDPNLRVWQPAVEQAVAARPAAPRRAADRAADARLADAEHEILQRFNQMIAAEYARSGISALQENNPHPTQSENFLLQEFVAELRKRPEEEKFSNIFEAKGIDLPEGHKCLDLFTGDAIDIPVKIVEKQRVMRDGVYKNLEKAFYFDYEFLHQWYFGQNKHTNPITRKDFNWSQVEPAYELVDKMYKILAGNESSPHASSSSESSSSSGSSESSESEACASNSSARRNPKRCAKL